MVESQNGQSLTQAPVANTAMLIRRPVAEVFEAFVDPAVTSRFWFTRGSGKLVEGAQVHWEWEMYGVGADVRVKAIEEHKRILVEWGTNGQDDWTTVEWLFEARPDGTTFVSVTNSGFKGSADELCAQACDSTQGFSIALAGAKALLEHDVELNVVEDRYPDAHVEGWAERAAGHGH